ncbi:MAG TPA: GntR family transcriptional regulator [Streptosporangiaceae bacterium]
MADPMYRQIADDLRRQIEAGELPPGAQLPTELELREKYDASRNTIRDATKWLITRGLVETRPGQGTFVIERIIPFVTTLTGDPKTASGGEGHTYIERGVPGGEAEPDYDREVMVSRRTPQASQPKIEIQQASALLAGELSIEENAIVVSRHQERFIDGTPWSLQTSFYPMSLVERGATRLIQAQNILEGTVEYLRDSLDIKQAGYRDVITVRAPDETETRFFNLPDDGRVSVLSTRRTGYDQNGQAFRLTLSVYPADRNQFVVKVGEVPADPTAASANRQS